MFEGMRTNHVKRRRTLWTVAAGLAIVMFAASAGFFFMEAKQAKENPDAVKQATSDRIIERVGQLYQLPADETPTVAQVQDTEQLKGQPFFTAAENGDYILIYTNAKTAFLYREKNNKLINVGPVNLDAQGQGVAGEQTETSN